MTIHLYSGAGNTFVVLDGRRGETLPEGISLLCREYRTDGLMILRASAGYDFAMEYYNSDGSGGMMCGNGGRCIVSFASFLGIKPGKDGIYRFLAPDGPHEAQILSRNEAEQVVKLRMKDVDEYRPALNGGWFVDTGTRHYVKFCEDVESIDIANEGPRYRHDPSFAPIGVNANFVQLLSTGEKTVFSIRTFEKGVEAETLACGTGITASAVALYLKGVESSHYKVFARQDTLSVDLRREGDTFTDVYLTGPTLKVL